MEIPELNGWVVPRLVHTLGVFEQWLVATSPLIPLAGAMRTVDPVLVLVALGIEDDGFRYPRVSTRLPHQVCNQGDSSQSGPPQVLIILHSIQRVIVHGLFHGHR